MKTTKRTAPAMTPKMAAEIRTIHAPLRARATRPAQGAWMPAMPAIPRAEMRAIVLDMIG
jgi:hypothetical protein